MTTPTPLDELKQRIDALSPRAKQWLHHTAQQLNDTDADGYIDHPDSRVECVAAGIIDQHGKYIELSGEANDLLYSEGYLRDYA